MHASSSTTAPSAVSASLIFRFCQRNNYRTYSSLNTDSSRAGRAQAAPLTAWLRVPLHWYSSTTHAYYDHESHSSIQKTYHSPSPLPNLPPTRRQFCGYCGTTSTQPLHGMSGRGVPYFEELIENSRLGRIRRQVGGHSSRLQWEVIKTVVGSDDGPISTGDDQSPKKRQRLDLQRLRISKSSLQLRSTWHAGL